MIALVATFLVAVYILGPDLVARWVLGFVVPRKNVVQTKSEEITRGVMWSLLPLTLGWSLRHAGPFALPPNSRFDLQVFFSGLYSDAFFQANRPAFFAAADSFIQLNICILLRLYGAVFFGSIVFNLLILNYGTIRHWLGAHHLSWLRPVFASTIIPRISEWHVLLSPMLLPSRAMNIEVDVLTKSGTLYQGALADKFISSDGSLQSITLANPRRFRREQFLEARKTDPNAKVEAFWKAVPGNMFVILVSDVTTLNVRHMPSHVEAFGKEFKEIGAAMNVLKSKVDQLQKDKQIPGTPKPS